MGVFYLGPVDSVDLSKRLPREAGVHLNLGAIFTGQIV